MLLAKGHRLGVYEIIAALGAGGMGEVYRARDTKLRREVAIKILPEAFALDPDRVARFQREAELLAALNHPNIAAVYGVEESAGASAIVMELVDGESLDEKLRQPSATGHQPSRGLPINEVLDIARQMADALEAAHERGVIHRDLKPANIKITLEGRVKVLDFGLAKMAESNWTGEPALAPGVSPANLTMSPTMPATHAGVILGTAAYMSPEQARGKPVDRRADIWAFGCVVFEMLAGRRAFDVGDTVSDAIASILKGDIDWAALPANTPVQLRTLLRRCLQKDPQKRLPHIGVARLELEEGALEPAAVAQTLRPAPLWKRAGVIVIVAMVVGALAATAAWRLKPQPVAMVAKFTIALPPDQAFTNPGRQMVAMSPDGRRSSTSRIGN